MLQFLLPLLEGLGSSGGLMAALGGGTLAGAPMAGGMQGPTQGSGIMGALSGGGVGNIMPSNFTNSKGTSNTSFNLPIPAANFKATQPNFYR